MHTMYIVDTCTVHVHVLDVQFMYMYMYVLFNNLPLYKLDIFIIIQMLIVIRVSLISVMIVGCGRDLNA